MTSPRPHVDHSAVAESINAHVHYTMYAAYAAGMDVEPAAGERETAALHDALAAIPDLQTRGWYDVSGYRADSDVFAWWYSERPEALQEANAAVLAAQGRGAHPVWSAVGVHRAAEFNRAHVPAFLAGDDARGYLCMYPFVRSREWYLLPDAERRELLREHGAAARDYGDVLANTTSAFALGDYEWLLAFEADDLVRLVDLMRELRATGARRHVSVETPFFTGPRIQEDAAVARLLG